MVYKWQQTLAAFFIILGLATVGWGVVAQLGQLRQPQDPRSQADVSPGVDVSWSDLATRIERGKSSSLDIKINSKSVLLTGVEFRGSIAGIPQSEIKFETLSTPGLQTIIQQLTTQDNKVLFHLVFFSDVNLATFFRRMTRLCQ